LLSLSFLCLDLSFEDVFIIHAFFAIMSFMSVAGVLVEYVSIVFLIVHVNRNIQIYYIKYNIIYLFNLLISYAYLTAYFLFIIIIMFIIARYKRIGSLNLLIKINLLTFSTSNYTTCRVLNLIKVQQQ
jgi:hypothetical protein